MDAKTVVTYGLESVNRATDKALEGLTKEEFEWQPKPDANSIGLILFHMARSEDSFIQAWIRRQPKLWEADHWYERLEIPKEDSGGHYSAEELASFRLPRLRELMEYVAAVRKNTLDFIMQLPPDEFDAKVQPPTPRQLSWEPTVGSMLEMNIIHLAEHAGEISYLRGLQRGLNK